MSRVATADSLALGAPPSVYVPRVLRLGNGRLVALVGSATNVIQASVSADGTAWPAPSDLQNVPGYPGLVAAGTHDQELDLFTLESSGGITPRGYSVDAATDAIASLPLTADIGSTPYAAAATYDGTRWHAAWMTSLIISLAPWQQGQASFGSIAQTTSSFGLQPESIDAGMSPDGGLVYISVADPLQARVSLTAVQFTSTLPLGSQYNLGFQLTWETVMSYSVSGMRHSMLVDSSGNIDFLLVNGTDLQYVRRTGMGIYSTPVTIYSGVRAGTQPAWGRDANTGNLNVVFEVDGIIASGELYYLQRTTSGWGTATRLLGGDSTGYRLPNSDRSFSLGMDLLYAKSDGVGEVDYGNVGGGSVPNAPVLTSPGANAAGLTPTIAWNYTNPSYNDPQRAYQIQVMPHGSGMPLWDTGEVVSSASSVIYAGPALTYGAAYDVQVRVWDSVTNSGAGTVSPWSSLSTFTPRQPPVITLQSLTSGGQTSNASPATLAAPDIAVTALYQQQDGDAANAYEIVLYLADGVTELESSGLAPLSPTVPAGGTISTGSWQTTALVNNTDYVIGLRVTDAVTALVGESNHWTVHVSWAPPADVTNLQETVDGVALSVAMTWTNPAGITGNVVEQSVNGGPWQALPLSGVFTSATVFPLPQTPTQYRVRTVNVLGVMSPGVTTPVYTLASPGDGSTMFGVWLTDTTDASNTVALGGIETWDATQWQLQDDVKQWVPFAQAKEIAVFGKTAFYVGSQHQYFIPDTLVDDTGTTIRGRDTVDKLARMAERRVPIYYRDRSGLAFNCVMTNFKRQLVDPGVHYNVYFELHETTAGLGPAAAA